MRVFQQKPLKSLSSPRRIYDLRSTMTVPPHPNLLVFSVRDIFLPPPARHERGRVGEGNHSASMIVPVSTMTLPPLPAPLLPQGRRGRRGTAHNYNHVLDHREPQH